MGFFFLYSLRICNFSEVNQNMKAKVKNTVKKSQSMLSSRIHASKPSKGSVTVLPCTITKWTFVYYLKLRLASFFLKDLSGIYIQDLSVFRNLDCFPP